MYIHSYIICKQIEKKFAKNNYSNAILLVKGGGARIIIPQAASSFKFFFVRSIVHLDRYVDYWSNLPVYWGKKKKSVGLHTGLLSFSRSGDELVLCTKNRGKFSM